MTTALAKFDSITDAPVEYRRAAFLTAQGHSPGAVSLECRLSVSKVIQICQEPWAIDYIDNFRNGRFLKVEEAMDGALEALPKAWRTLINNMDDPEVEPRDKNVAAGLVLKHDPTGTFASQDKRTVNVNVGVRNTETIEDVKRDALEISARPIFNPKDALMIQALPIKEGASHEQD